MAAIMAIHMPSASCGSLAIFIMAAHPVGTAAALVAALRHDVEVLVVDTEGIDAARVRRVGAEQLALRILAEDAHALALGHARILHDEVLEGFLALHFLGLEGHVEIEVEVAAEGREPLEAPAHALVIGGELGVRRLRHRGHRDVPLVEVHDHAVEAVGPARAVRTAFAPTRAEHEVVDDELAASVEKFGERLAAVAAFELVFLIDRLPRQRAPRGRELVATARERLFLRQQLPARGEPFLAGHDRVTLCHATLLDMQVFACILSLPRTRTRYSRHSRPPLGTSSSTCYMRPTDRRSASSPSTST